MEPRDGSALPSLPSSRLSKKGDDVALEPYLHPRERGSLGASKQRNLMACTSCITSTSISGAHAYY